MCCPMEVGATNQPERDSAPAVILHKKVFSFQSYFRFSVRPDEDPQVEHRHLLPSCSTVLIHRFRMHRVPTCPPRG